MPVGYPQIVLVSGRAERAPRAIPVLAAVVFAATLLGACGGDGAGDGGQRAQE